MMRPKKRGHSSDENEGKKKKTSPVTKLTGRLTFSKLNSEKELTIAARFRSTFWKQPQK